MLSKQINIEGIAWHRSSCHQFEAACFENLSAMYIDVLPVGKFSAFLCKNKRLFLDINIFAQGFLSLLCAIRKGHHITVAERCYLKNAKCQQESLPAFQQCKLCRPSFQNGPFSRKRKELLSRTSFNMICSMC